MDEIQFSVIILAMFFISWAPMIRSIVLNLNCLGGGDKGNDTERMVYQIHQYLTVSSNYLIFFNHNFRWFQKSSTILVYNLQEVNDTSFVNVRHRASIFNSTV